MSTLLSVREDIVESLRARLPAGVECKGIRGRFVLAELNDYAIRAPSVLIGVLEGSDAEDRGDLHSRLTIAAYVVTKHGRQGRAEESGLVLATVVMRLVQTGFGEWQRPQRIRFNNLYSTLIGADGVWLGAVTWQQLTCLADPEASATLAEFLTLNAEFDALPPAGVIDAGNLISVRPPEPAP